MKDFAITNPRAAYCKKKSVKFLSLWKCFEVLNNYFMEAWRMPTIFKTVADMTNTT